LDRRLEIFPPLSPTGENYWKSISAFSGVCHVSGKIKKGGNDNKKLWQNKEKNRK
jgi:hypothetical protein